MIRVGVGGWTYAPCAGQLLPQGAEARGRAPLRGLQLTTIEINGTFYRTQSAASFAKWRDETPDDFVFTVKGHRAVVNARRLAESRRGDRLVLPEGRVGARRSSGRCSGSSRRSRSSMPAISPASSRRCRGRRVARRSVTQSRSLRHVSRSGVRGPARRHNVAVRLCRLRRLPDDRRRHRRLRLMRAAAHRRDDRHRLRHRPTSTPGRSGRSLGRGRRARRSPAVRRSRAKDEAPGLHLHDQRRQGARTGRCYGADRAGQIGRVFTFT